MRPLVASGPIAVDTAAASRRRPGGSGAGGSGRAGDAPGHVLGLGFGVRDDVGLLVAVAGWYVGVPDHLSWRVRWLRVGALGLGHAGLLGVGTGCPGR